MPRQVDHAQRRGEIIEATLNVLAESGTRGLSFRAVAEKLGGSTTLITHYFPTQQDLVDAVSTSALNRWGEEISDLDRQTDDPRERLRSLLEWLVPATDLGLRDERSRINLLSGEILGDSNRATFDNWDQIIRGFLRSHLESLVPPERMDATVDLLRVTTNGITLSVVEHPESWSPSRQFAVIADVLKMLDLSPQ